MSAASMLSQGRAFWHARSRRERTLLAGGAIVLLVLALAQALFWLHDEGRRLRRAVPLAEASLGQMQLATDEHARLQALPLPARPALPVLLAGLQASSRARGLVLTAEAAGDGVRIKGQGSFESLIVWLADIQREHALRPLHLEIRRSANTAQFDASLVFPEPQ